MIRPAVVRTWTIWPSLALLIALASLLTEKFEPRDTSRTAWPCLMTAWLRSASTRSAVPAGSDTVGARPSACAMSVMIPFGMAAISPFTMTS